MLERPPVAPNLTKMVGVSSGVVAAEIVTALEVLSQLISKPDPERAFETINVRASPQRGCSTRQCVWLFRAFSLPRQEDG